jgi:hypothetical protein
MPETPPDVEPGPVSPSSPLPLREYGQPGPNRRLYGSTPPGIARIERAFRGSERGPAREFENRPGVIRTPIRRPLVLSTGLFVGVVIVPVGLLTWWQVSQGRFPEAWGDPAMGSAILFGTFLIWLTGVGLTPIGIAIASDGVNVFERASRPGRGIRRLNPWSDVGPLNVNPGGFYLASEGIGVNLTLEQARAVVADPRYPFRDRVSADVRARLGQGR